MSFTIEDNLKANYEKALEEGRKVLVKVCTVLLKGATVASYLTPISNTQKRKWGFTTDQIREIEAGRLPLNKMDISLLHLITRALQLVVPGPLEDLLKKLKVERNLLAHEQHILSLDKTKLRLKLDELKILYTKIFEELKTHCDPALIPYPDKDKDISDTGARLSTLEKTLDDLIHEEIEELRKETSSSVAKIAQSSVALDQNTSQSIQTLNQAVANVDVKLDHTVTNINSQVNDSMDSLEKKTKDLLELIETSIHRFNLSEQRKHNVSQNEPSLQGNCGQQQLQVQQVPALQGYQKQSSINNPQQVTADYRGQKEILSHDNQKLDIQQQHQADLLLQNDDPLSSFVLLTRKYHLGTTNFNHISIIKESVDFNGLKADYHIFSTETPKKECKLFIEGILIASSEGDSMKSAKEATAAQALQSLKTRCHTLQILKRHIGEETVAVNSIKSSLGTNDSSPQENFGVKFLKMSGCSDGRFGQTGSENYQPIKLEAVEGSQGMDLKVAIDVTDKFKHSIEKILRDYLSSDKQDDLIFSSEFTKEHRSEIQRIAHYKNLKGQSTGSGNNRCLIISRKEKIGKTNILQEVFKMGETEKYKLLNPGEPWENDEKNTDTI